MSRRRPALSNARERRADLSQERIELVRQFALGFAQPLPNLRALAWGDRQAGPVPQDLLEAHRDPIRVGVVAREAVRGEPARERAEAAPAVAPRERELGRERDRFE